MTCEPRLHIIQLRRIEVGHRTDGAVMIGMARGEEILENLVAQQAERLVVALALLILDDAALVIELFLRHRAEQMPHAIAFQDQRAVKGSSEKRRVGKEGVRTGRARGPPYNKKKN